MTSNYLADAYETYSSSAQAAQSLARNVMSAIFPLFAYQLVSLLESHVSIQDPLLMTVHRDGISRSVDFGRFRRIVFGNSTDASPEVWR